MDTPHWLEALDPYGHPAQIVTLKEQLLRLILVNLEMSHETKKIDMFENVGNENQLSLKSKLATPV